MSLTAEKKAAILAELKHLALEELQAVGYVPNSKDVHGLASRALELLEKELALLLDPPLAAPVQPAPAAQLAGTVSPPAAPIK